MRTVVLLLAVLFLGLCFFVEGGQELCEGDIPRIKEALKCIQSKVGSELQLGLRTFQRHGAEIIKAVCDKGGNVDEALTLLYGDDELRQLHKAHKECKV